MNYHVKRGEQTYGPYTLADLQRYVQSGNVQLTDLAQSEGMSDWVPVSQVVGNIAVTSTGAAVAPALQPERVSLPPNLHWALVLLLNAITFGLFSVPWGFVLASWAKKLEPATKAFMMIWLYTAVLALNIVLSTARSPLAKFMGLASVVCYVIGMFQVKSAMEEYFNSTENIGLKLSGPMTFFFNIVYLQYHVNAIAKHRAGGSL